MSSTPPSPTASPDPGPGDREAEGLRHQLEGLQALRPRREELAQRVARLEDALEHVAERIVELTFQRDKLKYNQARLRTRRFWRLAEAAVRAKRDRRALVRLPVTVLRVLAGPPVAPAVKPPVRREVSIEPLVRSAAHDRVFEVRLRQRYLTAPTTRRLADLRVAAILDSFSHAAFAPECQLFTFRPDNWRDVVEREQPHLLLVESAWKGAGGAWEYRVGKYPHVMSVGLPDLAALVAWCRRHDVPTVFWNKEDPVHFDRFAKAACLFDVVLTTDADRIPAYRGLRALSAEVVAALPFAAQPRLHNPVGARGERDGRPVFAGTYYQNRHPARRAQLEMLLDAARPFDLRIYDRTYGQPADGMGFPERFASHIVGAVPYDDMLRIYRRYRLFLNANSVTSSPTMFSRRVFELLACATPVVSTPSAGMEAMLGRAVTVVDDEVAAKAAIAELVSDDAAWTEASAVGVRVVMRSHTYAHRLARLATLAGFELDAYPGEDLTVVSLDRAAAERAAEVVASTGAEVTSLAPTDDDAGVGPVEAHRRLARRSETPWLLLVDPAGERVIDATVFEDLALARRFTHADVIGHSQAATHRYVDRLQPVPVVARRSLVAEHGWHATAAGRFQDAVRAGGATFYSVGP